MITFSIFGSVLALGHVLPISALKYGYNSVKVKRDPEIVARNFPDPKITLYGPAFQSNATLLPGFANGTQSPIDDDTLEHYMRELSRKNSWMTYRSAGFASEDGRGFPYVYLSSDQGSASLNTTKIKVWIQGGVHGNEPAGDMATLALLGKMDSEQEWASEILGKMDILVLPRYNPDGEFYFQRVLATNLDPNRDHIKLARQQTRDLKELFNDFEPHIALDMHEYSASSIYGRGVYQGADALLAAAKNLNIHSSIRNLSENLFASQIGSSLESAGFRWEPYVTNGTTPAWPIIRFDEAGTDAKIGRNAMGLSQTITFLFETRGIGLADQEFRRRTACSLTMITSTLEIAANNAELVYDTIESGREAFISSKEPIIVTDSNTLENRTFQMIWASNGSLADIPVEFMSATNARANLTRARPSAYLIPRGWADVAEKLITLGVEVETLPRKFIGIVEALNVTNSTFPDSFYEGTFTNTVKTSTLNRTVSLPAGSFMVSTAQKNAGLAFVALEPENIDSFVSFNIIPLEAGDEYPIFRLM